MDIKKLKGSVNFETVVDNMLSPSGCRTLGEVWSRCVDCGHCSYRNECEELHDHFIDQNAIIRCDQVIDFLLGNITMEDIKED